MGDTGFAKRFLESMRCGFYFRVIEEGALGAGDGIERIGQADDAISVQALYEARFITRDKELVRRAMAVPALSGEWRKELASVL